MVDSPPSASFFWLRRLLGVTMTTMVSDKSLLQKLTQKMSRLGAAQSKVTVTVTRGDVILAGTIEYEMHRSAIVKATMSVAGVRRVNDQLKFKAKERRI